MQPSAVVMVKVAENTHPGWAQSISDHLSVWKTFVGRSSTGVNPQESIDNQPHPSHCPCVISFQQTKILRFLSYK